MEFGAVVEKARQLHSKDNKRRAIISPAPTASEKKGGCCPDEVYGRICNTEGCSPPTVLSDTPGRKTVFVFGPDSIESIILKQDTYKCLQSLGFDQEYIYHEVG